MTVAAGSAIPSTSQTPAPETPAAVSNTDAVVAVPEEHPLKRVAICTICAGLALLNGTVGPGLMGQGYGAELFAAYINLLLGVTALWLGAGPLISRSLRQLAAGEPDPRSLAAAGLLILAGYSVFALLLTPQEFAARSTLNGLAVCSLLVVLLDYLASAFHGRLEAASALRPQHRSITVIRDGVEHQLSSAEIKGGDLVKAAAGETIYADGTVMDGFAELRERRYGGIERVVTRGRDQTVYAGSRLWSGSLVYRVEALGEETVTAAFDLPLEKIINEDGNRGWYQAAAKLMFYLLLCAAASAALYWRDRGASLGTIVDVMIAVLFSGALVGIAKALSELPRAAITALYRCGVTVQSSAVLEALARASRLVIDAVSLRAVQPSEVRGFDVLDQRVDEQALLSVVISLCSVQNEEYSEKLCGYLRGRLGDMSLMSLKEPREYPGKGISAQVEGVEFSLGSEEFLVERGVQLQPADVSGAGSGEYFLFIALHDEVVARIRMTRTGAEAVRIPLKELSSRGIIPTICGEESQGIIDALAKESGVELGYAIGGLTKEQYLEKLREWKTHALYIGRRPSPELVKASSLYLECFDELRWNRTEAPVTLYAGGFDLISKAFIAARSYVNKAYLLLYLFGAAALLLIPLAFTRNVAPAEALILSAVISVCAAAVVLHTVAPFRSR